MRLRRALTLLLLACFPFCIGSSAFADDRGTDGEEGDRHLDIKSVSNEADDEYVTYRVETYDEYHNVDDFSFFRWYFDTNDDGRFGDLCIRLEAVGDGRLRAMLYPKCGPESWSTAEATKVSDRVLEFRFPTRDFVVGGGIKPGEPFAYQVASEDIEGRTDQTPDRGSIAHSGLPEPASLFATPPPDGATGSEGGDGQASEGAAGQGEGEGIPVLSGLAEAIDQVPTSLLVLVILGAVVIVGGAVVVLRRQRAAISGVLAEPPGELSTQPDMHRAPGPTEEDAGLPPSAAGPWTWPEVDGGPPRVHTPDT